MTGWYLARAAGLVALIAFTASVVLGVLSSRNSRDRSMAAIDRRFLLQMAHRSVAVTGLAALAAHIVLLVTDSFVSLNVSGVLLPFTAGYRPLALGLGSVAVYAFILTAVSGAARGRLANSAAAAKRWRYVHGAAYIGWALSMGHGLLAGTDTGSWWTTAIYAVCGLSAGAAVLARWRSRTSQQSPTRTHSLHRSAS